MNENINKQLTQLITEFNLVAYKLQTLSESFEKLIEKVDSLTEKISETKERQLVDRQAIQTLEEKNEELEKKVSKLDSQVTEVRVGLAEKLAWGSLGGGLSAGLIKILEILVKG